ncbi:MAG TPA: gliding motility lipoprotein GldB [Chryseosolibacter sp.]
MKKVMLPLAIGLLVWSCGEKESTETCAFQPETTNKVTVDIGHFEDSVASLKSKKDVVAFFTRKAVYRDLIFKRKEYPNDSLFINEVFRKVSHPAFDTLLMETKAVFGDGSELEKQFEEAFTNLKYYYPDFVPPRVETVINGLDTDLFVSDSLIVVGLDSFLGKGAKYRPNVYEYLLRQYNKENIVPSCMLIYGIGNRFNKTDNTDKTVLADMIAYGKSFYFAKHLLPCVPDSIFIWYTPEEMRGSRKNQDLIWARLVQDKVLFSTSHVVKQKYLGERPKTIDVGPDCPGRIAQFVGWQIVNAYMEENADVTLPQMMNEPSASKIFRDSKYKPERN